MHRARLVVAGVMVVVGCVGSDPETSSSTTTLACRQKADADGNPDCASHTGKSRKLDCDDGEQTDQALVAGCEREKPGDHDVCCPTSVTGVATSSTPPGQDGGTTPPGTPPSTSTKARAIVLVTSTGPTPCTGTFFSMGTFSPEKLVEDGESTSSGTATVTCKVKPSGSSFDVSVYTSLANGGSAQSTGTLSPTPPAGTLDGIVAAAGLSLTRAGCTVTYPPGGGVSAGHLYATLTCPATGSSPPDACNVTAQMRFENCAQ